MEVMEYLIYVAIVVVIYKLVFPLIRGVLGELVVRIHLLRLPKKKYKVLNNIMLKTKRGTTQIDHIVVSIYGIFVIETKNYKGIIIGNGNSKEWIKKVYKKQYKFRNPIIQNKGHIRALSNILNMKEEDFVSIIVFLHDCKLKVRTQNLVIHTNKLIPIIRRNKQEKFSPKQMEHIVNEIKKLNKTGLLNKINHILYVKKRQNANKKSRYKAKNVVK